MRRRWQYVGGPHGGRRSIFRVGVMTGSVVRLQRAALARPSRGGLRHHSAGACDKRSGLTQGIPAVLSPGDCAHPPAPPRISCTALVTASINQDPTLISASLERLSPSTGTPTTNRMMLKKETGSTPRAATAPRIRSGAGW